MTDVNHIAAKLARTEFARHPMSVNASKATRRRHSTKVVTSVNRFVRTHLVIMVNACNQTYANVCRASKCPLTIKHVSNFAIRHVYLANVHTVDANVYRDFECLTDRSTSVHLIVTSPA